MQYEQLAAKVEEILRLFNASEAMERALGDNRFASTDYRKMEGRIRESLPMLRTIAKRLGWSDIGDFDPYSAAGEWQWYNARDKAQELLGELKGREELEALLGPTGPQLAASGLHELVWVAAAGLWDGEHRRQAVQDAYVAVEQRAKSRVDRPDLSGPTLWQNIFSIDPPKPGQPRLRFDVDERDKDTWNSRHLGAMALGQACSQGLRNRAAHSLDQTDEQQALEYLAAISILARWVDEAAVDRA